MNDQNQIKETFKQRRFVRMFIIFPTLIFPVIIGMLSEKISPEIMFGLLALEIILLIVAIIHMAFFWKCPSCNKSLGKTINPKFCNNCGISLQ